MQAVRFHEYGAPAVLRCEEVPAPDLLPDHLLVDVRAAGVNPIDWRIRKGQLKWVDWTPLPRTPGADVAGIVRAVGTDVEAFQEGDRVFAMLDPRTAGGYAEQAAVPATHAAIAPSSLSMVEAAGLPLVTLTAIQALRDQAHLAVGDHVLVNGASGGVGTVAVQWAKARGATVTGVCSHRNVDLVAALGADDVIDYTQEDVTRHDAAFDIVFDAFGNLSWRQMRATLRPGGRFVTTDISPQRFAETVLTRAWPGASAAFVMVTPSGADLETVAGLVEKGAIQAVIDRTYPLCEAVGAHRYSETKRAQGKIVLTTDQATGDGR